MCRESEGYEARMRETTIYLYKTSPETLFRDIGKALDTPEFRKLRPENETFIKINANYDRNWPGCNTSIWFLDALLRNLRALGFNDLSVIEGDLKLQPARETVTALGITKLLNRHNVPFIPLEELPRDNCELPLILHDAQLINTSVLHTHTFAVISCATKNLFGLLPVYREKYHNELSLKLLEILKNLRRANCKMFAIIDGTVGLEGGSMRMGDPKRLDLILTGDDALELDRAASKIMGFPVADVPLLRLALATRALNPAPAKVDGGRDFPNGLPVHPFAYKESRIAGFDLWLRRNRLTGRFLRYNSPLDRLAQHARRFYTARVYNKKKEKVMSGDWTEYR
ncbi:MAG: DUF362 domain-containing protein [Methanosarcinales archaeon]|nr:MAG: DUF362 domain-containing protein [Methanosarcinales archaeon]